MSMQSFEWDLAAAAKKAQQEQAIEDANKPWRNALARYDQPVEINNGNSSLSALRSMAMLKKGDYVGQAAIDSGNQSDMAIEGQNRRLMEMGVNPSAGRYVGSARSAAIDAAAAKAASMTRAGRWVDQENFSRMGQVANMEQQNNSETNRWRFQNKANQFNSVNTLVGLRMNDMAANNKAADAAATANAYSLRTANNQGAFATQRASNASAWNKILK